MRRLSTYMAIGVAVFCGCAAFVALLPWGDPCSFVSPSDGSGCNIVLSPLQEHIRNVSFGGICLLIGIVGGLLTRSHRLLVGALSSPVAFLFAHFAIRWIYPIAWSEHSIPWSLSGIYPTSAMLVGIAAIGLVGAALSRYVRLTTASSAA